MVVIGYTDASFQTDKDDFRSQSGYVFCLNDGAVSWESSKQDTVANSTTEAEYITASSAAKEAVWIKKLADNPIPNFSFLSITGGGSSGFTATPYGKVLDRRWLN